MNKLYHKLIEKLGISGRDFVLFSMTLLVAFSIWLIHNLSLKYNTYLTTTVVANCNLEGHSNISINQADIVARGRARGFKIIKSEKNERRKVVTVSFNTEDLRHKENDLYYVLGETLKEYADVIYGDDVTLDYFVSDTIYFRFPVVEYKKVPVKPVYSISYAGQYMNTTPLRVYPDSITIYGEVQRLAAVNVALTKPIEHTGLNAALQDVVKLEPIKNVRMSDSEVRYIMDVTRYVEITRTLPIRIVNVPADKNLQIFPSQATVTMYVVYPVKNYDYENIRLQLDYNKYIASVSGKCPIELAEVPDGIISYDINPIAISCILEED